MSSRTAGTHAFVVLLCRSSATHAPAATSIKYGVVYDVGTLLASKPASTSPVKGVECGFRFFIHHDSAVASHARSRKQAALACCTHYTVHVPVVAAVQQALPSCM